MKKEFERPLSHFMQPDRRGKFVPSHFAGGSYDALLHRPISIRRPNSVYSRLLVILDEIRASDRPLRHAEEICKLYAERYKSETIDYFVISKALSRFCTFTWVDQDKAVGDKAGAYSLKPDIEIHNVRDLLRRVDEVQKEFKESTKK